MRKCRFPFKTEVFGCEFCGTGSFRRSVERLLAPLSGQRRAGSGTQIESSTRLSGVFGSADEHTFFFADLAGFTAMTEAMGDEPAAELAREFCAAIAAVAPDHQAEEIKRIGDAVLLRGADAGAAIRLALLAVHDIGGRHGFLNVRVGMHTGPAVERDGDWFGATVNLAARVSAEATGREVLLTEATRAAAGDLGGIEFHERGRRELKNVAQPLLLYAAVRAGERTAVGLPVDPVCRMALDPEHSVGRLQHEGVEYHFCSLACAAKFSAAPEQYATKG